MTDIASMTQNNVFAARSGIRRFAAMAQASVTLCRFHRSASDIAAAPGYRRRQIRWQLGMTALAGVYRSHSARVAELLRRSVGNNRKPCLNSPIRRTLSGR